MVNIFEVPPHNLPPSLNTFIIERHCPLSKESERERHVSAAKVCPVIEEVFTFISPTNLQFCNFKAAGHNTE